MPVRQYANAPATTLANSCTSLATSIVVASTTGLPITFPYTLIIDRGLATEEAVSVTAAAGTTLTVTRGIDGTTAFAHSQSAAVVHGITAQDIREANAHVNANSGVHGATGSVVGTTDTQTLTNKTLALGSNTVSGTKAQLNTAVTDGDVVFTDNAIFGAWTAWTPTITAETGTFTAASGAGRYTEIGKTVIWSLTITITTVGTAGGAIRFTLPVNALAATTAIGNGRQGSNGNQVHAYTATTSTAFVFTYNNGSPIAVGVVILNGTYEKA